MINIPNNLTFSQKFIRGETQYGIWGIASKVIGFLNTLITISSLSLYLYGVFQLILSLYGAATYFTTIGGGVVNNDITHLIREKKEGSAKRLFYEYNLIRILSSVILWAVFFFGANLFAEKYTIGFVEEVRIISFLFLVEVFFNAAESLLAARLNFAVVASRSAITKIAQLLALVFFLFFRKVGLQEIFISMIFGSFVSTLTMIPAFIKLNSYWVNVPISKEKMLISIFSTYGKWDLLRQFFSQAVDRIQPWLIKIFVSTEAVAIFSVATAFIGVIKDLGFPTKTLKALVPLHLDDKEKTQKTFIRGLRYIFLLSIFVALGAFIGVPFVVKLFLQQYIPSLSFFYVMLLGIPVFGLGIITGTFTIALRKQKFLFFQKVSSSLVTIFFYLALLPFFGLWALSVESVVTPFLMFLMSYFYMMKAQPGVSFNFRDLVAFGREDFEFVKIIYKDFKSMIAHKFSNT